MVLSLLLPALTIPLAQAGVPVIYDGVSGGDAASLLASVSEHTGLAAAELDAMPLDELLAAPPQALGDAVMRRCAGGPTELETVRAELVRAEAAGQQGDHLGAQDHLDLAVANLGCLGELVDTRVAARIFMLRGAIEAEQGDTEAARGELRTALAFAPDLAWDLSMPGEGQPLLIEERATPAALQVRVVPAGTSSGPWVDGRTLQGKGDRVAVASGLHLAQRVLAIRPELPVVLYSGYADVDVDHQATEAGISAVLAKPLKRAELARCLRRLLDR